MYLLVVLPTTNATFSVAATGTGLTYQWQKDGVDISGAIANQYSASTQGQYRVRVTNNGCSAVSSAIPL